MPEDNKSLSNTRKSQKSSKHLKKVKSRKPSVEHNILEEPKMNPIVLMERYAQIQKSQESMVKKGLTIDPESEIENMTI